MSKYACSGSNGNLDEDAEPAPFRGLLSSASETEREPELSDEDGDETPPVEHGSDVVQAVPPPPAAPHRGPIPAADCLGAFWPRTTLEEVLAATEHYRYNVRSELEESNPGQRTRVLGKNTFVQGEWMKAVCHMHRPHRCHLFIPIRGEFNEAQARVTQWLIYGSVCSQLEHKAAGQRLLARWNRAQAHD